MAQNHGVRQPEPKGISGWLLIPAIGLILSPIKSLYGVLVGLAMIQSFAPELMSDFRLWLSCLIDVGLIVATIVVAVLFFQRYRIVVPAFIGLMATNVFLRFVQASLTESMFKEVDSSAAASLMGATIYGAIWIPYFLVSQRVKNTFTEDISSNRLRNAVADGSCRIRCDRCGTQVTVSAQYAGHQFRCPVCENAMAIQREGRRDVACAPTQRAEEVASIVPAVVQEGDRTVYCPACGRAIHWNTAILGIQVNCPDCRRRFSAVQPERASSGTVDSQDGDSRHCANVWVAADAGRLETGNRQVVKGSLLGENPFMPVASPFAEDTVSADTPLGKKMPPATKLSDGIVFVIVACCFAPPVLLIAFLGYLLTDRRPEVTYRGQPVAEYSEKEVEELDKWLETVQVGKPTKPKERESLITSVFIGFFEVVLVVALTHLLWNPAKLVWHRRLKSPEQYALAITWLIIGGIFWFLLFGHMTSGRWLWN